MKPNKVILKNKLRVITAPLPVKSSTALILVKVGSRNETKKYNGIAHFAEHMFFKGTKKRPTALDISSLIDGIGGEFNAFTSKEFTGFYIKSAAAHLNLALDVLSDMLLNALVKKEEVERERNVVLEERRMYLDTPMRYISEVFESLLYGDHPLGWDTVGTEKSLQNITRESFLEYMNTYYHPNNMLVVVSGEVKQGKTELLVDEYLGGIKPREKPSFLPAKYNQAKPAVKLFYKDTEQAHMCLGVRSYQTGHPDRYVVSLIHTILGANMSSRLFIELRERRGLAYYVRSGVEEYLDTGAFAAQAGVHQKKIEDSIQVILSEFKKLAEEEISEVELKKAKEYLKGRLILDLEDSREVATLFGLQELLEHKTRTPEEIFKNIDKVTRKDILRVSKDLFKNESLNLAIIGPYKKEGRFLNLLNF